MRRSLLVAFLFSFAASSASARPVVVELVASDNAHPNGFTFRGSSCDSLPRYTFRFPSGARSARLHELFKPGLELSGPDAPGYGSDGAGEPFIVRYARLSRINRRVTAGRTVFDLYARAEPATCAGYTDTRNGSFVPGWVTLPLQVFGTFERRVDALHTLDVAGTLRRNQPASFAVGRRQLATGLRWRNWGRREATARGQVGPEAVTISAYNPGYCRGRLFYEDYLVESRIRRDIFALSPSCRRLIFDV